MQDGTVLGLWVQWIISPQQWITSHLPLNQVISKRAAQPPATQLVKTVYISVPSNGEPPHHNCLLWTLSLPVLRRLFCQVITGHSVSEAAQADAAAGTAM